MADSIEKGFNDSELEDIMSEIESLEKEYVEGSSAEPKEEDDSNTEVEDEVVSASEEVVAEKVVSINKSSSGKPTHSKMDFSISGDMQMQLNFTVAGQVVKLNVDEENGFRIEMEGGATFSLPLSQNKKVG